MNATEVAKNIFRLTVPFLDIFTTVYLVKTDDGALLFDTATYPEDTDNYLFPLIKSLGVENELKYVFISHSHRDHAGGVQRLVELFPKVTVLSRGLNGDNIAFVNDGDVFLGCLKVVTIPGHSADSMALLDIRNNTLISGDSLQLYGIFGSGEWGANITLVKEHLEAIEKLKKMDVKSIYTAHDYHPYGYKYCDADAISKAYDACIEPLIRVKELIRTNPTLDNVGIQKIYNSEELPTLSVRVVNAVRQAVNDGLL